MPFHPKSQNLPMTLCEDSLYSIGEIFSGCTFSLLASSQLRGPSQQVESRIFSVCMPYHGAAALQLKLSFSTCLLAQIPERQKIMNSIPHPQPCMLSLCPASRNAKQIASFKQKFHSFFLHCRHLFFFFTADILMILKNKTSHSCFSFMKLWEK